jgi:hypothetical protein
MANTFQVTFDAADPAKLAEFWADALGYTVQPPPPGFGTWEEFALEVGIPEDNWGDLSAIVDPEGGGPRVLFQRVPEGKTSKNRVHLDVNVGGGSETPPQERRVNIEAAADRLIGIGATKVEAHEDADRSEFWIVMLDPESNEFCVQ